MITNSSLTVYHKSGLDNITRLEKWTRYNYDNVWFFGGKGASIDKGYDNANDVQIRIPYDDNLNFANFSIGDIVVQGTLTTNIETQSDLDSYTFYNITTLKNNNFGQNPHIHIGGR